MFKNDLLTPKQYEIMFYLFKVRGANVFQIIHYTTSVFGRPTNQSTTNRMYELLNRLKAKNLVTITEVGQKKPSMYHLTQFGLEVMYEELEVENYKIGKGFNDDFGYFPYQIYKPPTKAVKHFLNQTDVHTMVLNLQKKSAGIFDYRDNLYSKVSYEYPEGKKIIKGVYKPDGELRIDDDYYFIEVDRQTERSTMLDQKFANLHHYLTYLKKMNKKLPKGIIFIREETMRKEKRPYVWTTKTRYTNLFASFKKECKIYTESIDLLYFEIQNTQTVLIELLNENKVDKLNGLSLLLNSFIKRNQSNICTISISKEFGEDGFLLMAMEEENKRKLYMFSAMEGYESLNWQKGFTLYQSQKEYFHEIFFIPTYQQLHTVSPESLYEKRVITKEELDFYNHVHHLNITNIEKPLWFNHEHKEMIDSPLLSFV